MLDFAEFVAINKFDRKGAADALRDVAKQVQRNREAFGKRPDEMPVFGTMASRFNDDGVTALYQAIVPRLAELGPAADGRHACRTCDDAAQHAPGADRAGGAHALPRRHRRHGARLQAQRARAGARSRARSSSCARAARMLRGASPTRRNAVGAVIDLADEREARLDADARAAARRVARTCSSAYAGDEYVVKIRDTRDPHRRSTTRRCRGNKIRKVALPAYEDHGEILKWLMLDNVPGSVPVHRRHVRVQARERGPDAHVRRRGRRLPHQHAASSCSRPACRPSACRPRSTRSRCTATTRRCGPTSTARSATRASRSRRSTT